MEAAGMSEIARCSCVTCFLQEFGLLWTAWLTSVCLKAFFGSLAPQGFGCSGISRSASWCLLLTGLLVALCLGVASLAAARCCRATATCLVTGNERPGEAPIDLPLGSGCVVQSMRKPPFGMYRLDDCEACWRLCIPLPLFRKD